MPLKCCFGEMECAYHNNVALEGLEEEVRNAAQIGQALLIRHETYMAEAEEERNRMAANVNSLETDNKQLEVENAQAIDENCALLSQLEELNDTVAESDTHIKSLTATLQATRHELQRITILARRTSQLEAQLSALEIDQAQLQQELATTKEDERSAVQRWKKAERTVDSLQQQIDRIEKEAREERERHFEIFGRLERRRAVERELESAAGRLKGAAATSTLGEERNGSSVVSHFVKDILQDNANLQFGIVELREMLLSSNEEVEGLRERMTLHQPVVSDNEDGSQKPTLKKELGLERSDNGSPALHVHHHYHAAAKPETIQKDKTQQHRRPKKKRNIITPGIFTPLSSSQSLRTPTAHYVRPTPPSAAAAILSQTSVTIPPPASPISTNRWSEQSSQTISSFASSSVPSSPQSVFRDSMFDRIDHAMDFSRPTSPESNSMGSPMFLARHRNGNADTSLRSFSTPAAFQLKAQAPSTKPRTLHPTLEISDIAHEHDDSDLNTIPNGRTTILEEGEVEGFGEDSSTPGLGSDISTDEAYSFMQQQLKPHRSASHESLLSVSGMDIHTLRQRPSQMFNRQGLAPRTPFGISSPSTALSSSKPVLSAMTATVRPAHARRGYDSGNYNRSLLSNVIPITISSREQSTTAERPTLGERVGGWVWGKWGVAPMASTGSLRAKASLAALDGRASGVNQAGAVKGLRPRAKAPSNVRPMKFDKDLLQESLKG
ncbi:MAG: hypothetical protein M1830_000247 [Pleopsidium flavum]|nr:MAG: hypothetical protein M1830_000247 [Pleopsidium flavum]